MPDAQLPDPKRPWVRGSGVGTWVRLQTPRHSLVRALRVGSCVLGVLGACTPKPLHLPTDRGTPFPDAPKVHEQVSSSCSGVRTLSAELALSGHAGRDKLRGRVLAGFARPASMRLEGVAPFGSPMFILATHDKSATLLLSRDNRVLRDARAEDILGALTGISLGAADLQAILTGCVVPSPRATGGALHSGGMASIDLEGDATLLLQRAGATWQVRAARRSGLHIEYDAWHGRFPQSVRLRSETPGVNVNLLAQISQLETNVALGGEVFQVTVPGDAAPISLEELRNAGPLRDASTSSRDDAKEITR
jgi:hypothetical protein